MAFDDFKLTESTFYWLVSIPKIIMLRCPYFSTADQGTSRGSPKGVLCLRMIYAIDSNDVEAAPTSSTDQDAAQR